MDNKVLNSSDVMNLLKCKRSKAYDVIKLLNRELSNKGYLTINGKVPSSYLFDRLNIC